MGIRIAVCGGNEEIRLSLIRCLTPDGIVPERPESSNRVYETETLDYLDCAVPAGEYRAFLSGINENFGIDFDPGDSAKSDAIWYCLDGKTGIDELRSLSGFPAKALFVITDGDALEGKKLEERIAFLEKFGIDKEKIVIVSLGKRTGFVLLMSRTKRMLEINYDFQSLFSGSDVTLLRTSGNDWISKEADSFIYWAAGRAFAIAIIPLPLADVGPLIANEAYMFYKLGALYGYAVDKTILAGFLGCLGASVGGKIATSFIPFLKAPIAAGITYAVGCAAKAYFESDMKLGSEELRNIFQGAKKRGEKIDWKTKQ